MTPEVTQTAAVLNKIILNVWIEIGPVILYGPKIHPSFRFNSYVTGTAQICALPASPYFRFTAKPTHGPRPLKF
jgi:hypothetical protein